MPSSHAIDLRSDTFTVPDAAMRRVMAEAEVGDDVWGEDPTVRRLEERTAELLGKAAAVYVASGTMGNLISVAAQTSPGDEVIADAEAHVAIYEAAGTAVVAGVQLRLLESPEGVPEPDAVRAAVREQNIHLPISRLICVENTHNRRGGAAVSADRIDAAAGAAHELGLRVHCDGARLFNAAVALDTPVDELVAECDSVSVCLSKGLGAPVGSVVAGDHAFIESARRWRKRLGGGMRQAGIIAAAGLYALEHNVHRLAEDHAHARRLADALRDVTEVLLPSVPTNLVLLHTREPAGVVSERLAERGVLAGAVGPHTIRCMTYLNVGSEDVDRAITVLREVLAADASAA
jgi:threonine aldolase